MLGILSVVTSFFGENKDKIIHYAIRVIGIILILLFVYLKGHSNGVDDEKLRLNKEYTEILEKKMKKNTERLTREFNIKLQNQQVKVVKEIEYKTKTEYVEKTVNKYPKLTNPDCAYPVELVDSINKSTRRTK